LHVQNLTGYKSSWTSLRTDNQACWVFLGVYGFSHINKTERNTPELGSGPQDWFLVIGSSYFTTTRLDWWTAHKNLKYWRKSHVIKGVRIGVVKPSQGFRLCFAIRIQKLGGEDLIPSSSGPSICSTCSSHVLVDRRRQGVVTLKQHKPIAHCLYRSRVPHTSIISMTSQTKIKIGERRGAAPGPTQIDLLLLLLPLSAPGRRSYQAKRVRSEPSRAELLFLA
jgi:hypothetical protein